MPSYPVRIGADNAVLKERTHRPIIRSLGSHLKWTMPPEHHRGQQETSSWEDLPRGRNPLPSKLQEAFEKVWSQSVVHYHFELKMKFSLCLLKKASGVGMKFLILDFLGIARLDHTDLYDFENCHWVQGFLYLSHIYSKLTVSNF